MSLGGYKHSLIYQFAEMKQDRVALSAFEEVYVRRERSLSSLLIIGAGGHSRPVISTAKKADGIFWEFWI